MFFIMVRDMRGLFLPYGFLSSRASVGGSVAKAREAKVSMIRLTHNICTAFRGESCGDKLESYVFPRKIISVKSFSIVSVVRGDCKPGWRQDTEIHRPLV